MKIPFLPLVCIVLLAAGLLVAGCSSVFPAKPAPTPLPTPIPTPETVAPTPVPACGFTTCHGADFHCGVPPVGCTEEHRMGDQCRMYARCGTENGSCSLVVTSPKFATCKACADSCAIASGPDNLAALSCEEKC